MSSPKLYNEIRRRFIAVFLIVCPLFLSGCKRPKESSGPNLVLISVDTLRADHVSTYGYKKNTSPHIDALAGRGHVFRRAYTCMPTTLPSHLAAFTGLFPWKLGVVRNGLEVPAEAVTLAEILQDSGYETAAFVSAVSLSRKTNINQGFALYDEPPGLERSGRDTVAKALKWLKGHPQKPFFLFVHFFEPHTPYRPPKEMRSTWNVPKGNFPPGSCFVGKIDKYTPEVIENTIRAYDAEIAEADRAVGTLLNWLNSSPIADSTHYIFISDHGESLDELLQRYGYLFDHGEFLYHHQLHIPLVIVEAGKDLKTQDHHEPVSIMDVMPTALNLLDIEVPAGIDGRSLLPLTGSTGRNTPLLARRRSFLGNTQKLLSGEAFSLIDDQWHFISSDGTGNELYDLAEDPLEKKNLLSQQTKVAEQMREFLRQIKKGEEASKSEAPSVQDTKQLRQLRSLGYMP